MMMHFLDEIDPALEAKIAVYLRAHQAEHGGWPLYHGGELDISCTVKAYYALKLAGDSPDAPHMQRARATRFSSAAARAGQRVHAHRAGIVRQVPWRAVPYIPVEIMLLPSGFRSISTRCRTGRAR
jgi:squalene-hopene/tetraprenyl-beta-curcumene cyclase